MLIPNKTKYRRVMKGRIKGPATSGNTIAFGDYALQATGSERVTSRQIESARQAMTRYIKRGGKGSPEFFVAKVRPGTVLFEMQGVSEEVAREAMRLASHKLPVKTKFIMREAE